MLHVGIASWQNPDALQKSIQCLQANTNGEWKLLIVDNASPDPRVRQVIESAAAGDARIIPQFLDSNTGYAGGINRILAWAIEDEGHHVCAVDNDAFVYTPGWNDQMADILNRHHDVALVGPLQFGAYHIQRAGWTEVLWTLGCFWMGSVARFREVGFFDESLHHQDEVDWQTRARLAGWKIAGVPLNVEHQAKATSSPEAQARINAGVVNWVDKWAAYYGGKGVTYHSANVLRFADWSVNALYLEEYFQKAQQEGRLEQLNQNVRQIKFEGQDYDVIEVLRHPHLYRDRLV